MLSKNNDENTKENSKNLLINELKFQYDREIDLKKSIDSKINSFITTSSSITTLNVAIGVFFLSKIENTTNFYYYIPIILLGCVTLFAIVSILRFTSIYGIRMYKYPFGHQHFFENNVYSWEKVNKIKDFQEDDFKLMMIKNYIESIKTFDEINEERTNKVKKGQIYLTASLIAITSMILFILTSLIFGKIVLI
jgi:hypothetical protein